MTLSAAQARTICNSASQGNDSTARRAMCCMTSGFWPVSKPTSSSLLPNRMLPSGVWRMLPSGIGHALVVRSVTRIWPRCGRTGALHAQAIATSQRATLVALCDSDPARLAGMSARHQAAPYAEVADLLANQRLDAVTIATPDHLHVTPALAAIAAGCHVFCEKPLAENLAEAERMARAAQERGVRLAVDYNRRFGFGYRTARRLVDDGAIGTLQSCLVRVSDGVPPPAVARHPHVIFTTLLTHHFDLLRWFGGEVARVHATAGAAEQQSLVSQVSISLAFASGQIGTLVAGYRAGQTRTCEWMELSGTGGAITVEGVARRVTLVRLDPDRREVFESNSFTGGDDFYSTIVAHLHAFIDDLADARTPAVTARDALASLALAAAAARSLETGLAVEVQQP